MINSRLTAILSVFTLLLSFNALTVPSHADTDVTAQLAKTNGVHPRLFLKQADADKLRLEITGDRRAVWLKFLVDVSFEQKRPLPVYSIKLDQRLYGGILADYAFAWLMTHDHEYLDSAAALVTTISAFPTWDSDEKPGSPGLACAHYLLGLSMLYDYAYNDLQPSTRDIIRSAIERHAADVSTFFATSPHGYVFNQAENKACGLMAAGIALYDENPDAVHWLEQGLAFVNGANRWASPDGASQEGVGYWNYGQEHFAMLMYMANSLLGRPIDHTSFWTNTPYYGLYMMLPRNSWSEKQSVVNFEDCPRYSWCGDDYDMREYAAQDRNGYAQWLADELGRQNVILPSIQHDGSPWLNVLWYDPSVKATPPTSLPTLRSFPNMGIVSARSSWSGNESLVAFKCGFPSGDYVRENQPSLIPEMTGHAHPDAGHFVIFGYGDWLISNIGYVQRQTKYHNTLLIDGHGEYGEHPGFFMTELPQPGQSTPKILQAESSATIDRISGDATGAYAVSDGLKKFVRHLYYVKPNALIVADDIETAQPHHLDLLFHPETTPVVQADQSLLCSGDHSVLRMQLLTPDEATMTPKSITVTNRHVATSFVVPQVDVTSLSTNWKNIVVFTWAPKGSLPATAVLDKSSGAWKVTVDGQKIPIDWAD